MLLKMVLPPNNLSSVHPPDTVPGPALGTDEDCLYLSVFVNELPRKSSSLKPVIVFLNEGGFLIGSGSSENKGPDYLLHADIVVVFFNYRCGAFGFLSLENEEVPGNAGLKDQTLALKWVHDNIESFGGDPNNVTIFGLSAGGASVLFHLLSPSSRGLFHKAVSRSGTALDPWALQDNSRGNALKLAKKLGCSFENQNEVLRFLQYAPADDIVAATTKIMSEDKEMVTKKVSLVFLPCVEISGVEPFLSDTPRSLMERGQFAQVPVIIGGCAQEGGVLAYFDGLNDEAFTRVNENPVWVVPSSLGLKPGSAQEKEAEQDIWDFYFKGNWISWTNIEDYLQYQADVQFNIGIDTTRRHLLKYSTAPVYTYLFTNHTRCFVCFLLELMHPKFFSKICTKETCHGADGSFFFHNSILHHLPLTQENKEDIKRNVDTLAAFASTGNPNHSDLGVEWRKDSLRNPCYMDIGTTWTLSEGTAFTDRMDFWKGLLQKYNSN
ncbi:cholinesterase 2-like [Homalodisca vitripennis]|uniref:cholinesterase 2-like n=1 Tax=Homalodisca vitripennis TaxID=197043 RepID=UPI001EEABF57|nr:cholinesterase 2-like [Homalodisca vitripennis]XP_046676964.1 cholinesterase 2-like [Homalodisca vitripennis]